MLQDVYCHLGLTVNEKNALQIPKQQKEPGIAPASVSYGAKYQLWSDSVTKRNQFSIPAAGARVPDLCPTISAIFGHRVYF
jgi:hypothetical protein